MPLMFRIEHSTHIYFSQLLGARRDNDRSERLIWKVLQVYTAFKRKERERETNAINLF
jgi:hypothetical protein